MGSSVVDVDVDVSLFESFSSILPVVVGRLWECGQPAGRFEVSSAGGGCPSPVVKATRGAGRSLVSRSRVVHRTSFHRRKRDCRRFVAVRSRQFFGWRARWRRQTLLMAVCALERAGGENQRRAEAVCELRRDRRDRSVDRDRGVWRVRGGVVVLVLDLWDVAERGVQPDVVEPADPFDDRALGLFVGTPEAG